MRITNEQRRNNVVTAWGALQAPGWRFDGASIGQRFALVGCDSSACCGQSTPNSLVRFWECGPVTPQPGLELHPLGAWRVHIFGRSTLSDNVPRSMAFWDGFQRSDGASSLTKSNKRPHPLRVQRHPVAH